MTDEELGTRNLLLLFGDCREVLRLSDGAVYYSFPEPPGLLCVECRSTNDTVLCVPSNSTLEQELKVFRCCRCLKDRLGIPRSC